MKTRALKLTVAAIGLLGLAPDLGIISHRNENVIFVRYLLVNIIIY
jgi:hypothetical protein